MNFLKFRLKGTEQVTKYLADLVGVSAPAEAYNIFKIIEINIDRIHREKKAKLLGIPEHKVTFRRKANEGKRKRRYESPPII